MKKPSVRTTKKMKLIPYLFCHHLHFSATLHIFKWCKKINMVRSHNFYTILSTIEVIISGVRSIPSSPCSSLLNPLRRQRGEKKPIPDDLKDEKYYERRKRNNQAAKKSRDARKMREDHVRTIVIFSRIYNFMQITECCVSDSSREIVGFKFQKTFLFGRLLYERQYWNMRMPSLEHKC